MTASSRSSYTETRGPLARLREATQLLRKTRQSWAKVDTEVKRVIEQCRIAEAIAIEKSGRPLEGLAALEIGVGQLPRQVAYFARKNDVTAIDIELAPCGFDPAGYWRLARTSGASRALKTMARQMTGFDARYRRAICRELGIDHLPPFKLLQMNAEALTFADAPFDFVYSFDVFEHLPNPAAVLREAKRVLRPGGVMLAYIHLYTCDSGHHDLRVYLPGRGGLPYWAHLRPTTQPMVQTYVTLNRLRLDQWRELFDREMPGSSFSSVTLETDDPVRNALPSLRLSGELTGYTDEELLTDRIVAVWKK